MSASDDYPDPCSTTDQDAMYSEIDRLRSLVVSTEQQSEILAARDRYIANLQAQNSAWMNGVADVVEPLGFDRHAACGPADLLPGLLDLETTWRLTSQLMYLEQQRWQGMAEDLWEELQMWHADDCPTGDLADAECTCHQILAAKWDELTHADDYADDGFDDATEPPEPIRPS